MLLKILQKSDFAEKLLIALLVAMVGAGLTFINSELSAKNDFRHEINKVRIEKMGELWEKFYEIEKSFNLLFDEIEMMRIFKHFRDSPDQEVLEVTSVKALKHEFDADVDEFMDLLGRSEFYLGKSFYNTYYELFRSLAILRHVQEVDMSVESRPDLYADIEDYDYEASLNEAKDRIESFKLNVIHIQDILLENRL